MGKSEEELKAKYDIYENEDEDATLDKPVDEQETSDIEVVADSLETKRELEPTTSTVKNKVDNGKDKGHTNKRLIKQLKKFSHKNLGVAIYKAKFLHRWLESFIILTVVGNIINWIVIKQDSEAYWDKQFTARQAMVVVTVSMMQAIYFIVFVVWIIIFSIGYYRFKAKQVK